MPAYSYVALNRNGSKKKGIVSAESEREARRLVKDLKLTPLKVTESKDLGKTLRIKNKDVVLMTRQLATLLEASTPLVESIEITANQTKNQNLVYVLYGLKEEIIQGYLDLVNGGNAALGQKVQNDSTTEAESSWWSNIFNLPKIDEYLEGAAKG